MVSKIVKGGVRLPDVVVDANHDGNETLIVLDAATSEQLWRLSHANYGNERLTAALIDRLTYHAHLFEFRGQSYRFRDHPQLAQEVLTDSLSS